MTLGFGLTGLEVVRATGAEMVALVAAVGRGATMVRLEGRSEDGGKGLSGRR